MATTEQMGRRQRRRRETIEEILDLAVEVMAENGAGGLALGEIARRMGIQPPSLYVYFDSKNAIYDAIFARGWAALLDSMAPLGQRLDDTNDGDDAPALLLIVAQHFTRWAVENRSYAQLMFWRPCPATSRRNQRSLQPSRSSRRTMRLFAELQRRGVIRADVDPGEVSTAWTVVISRRHQPAPVERADPDLRTRPIHRPAAGTHVDVPRALRTDRADVITANRREFRTR